MAKLNNIADAIKYVDAFQKHGAIQMIRQNAISKTEERCIRAFIYACKSFCYDRGITISDPSEVIEPDYTSEDLKKVKSMVEGFVRKEAYFLAQYDEKCFEGWSIISYAMSRF